MAKPLIRRAVQTLVVVVVVGIGVAAVSCVAHRPHRTPIDAAPQAPVTTSQRQLSTDPANRDLVSHASIENHGRFRLGIVEFDDQGRFWSRGQYAQVISDLRDVYKAHAGAQVVVFVHGWKHSSAVCDQNLACFRQLLDGFAELEGTGGRPVYGVYVGWRGLSVSAPILKELTFWGRKETAHRIGNADVVELLSTLETLHRQERDESPGTRLTTIGHSFGAAVVFSAISGSLKERLAAQIATPADRRRFFVGFGTLTILVNPAFEATLYDGVDRMVGGNPGLFDARNPRVLVTVASEGDGATRYLFPMGRWISTLLQRTRSSEQRSEVLHTLGNYAPFVTHRLDQPASLSNVTAANQEGDCLCHANVRRAFGQNAAFRSDALRGGDEEFFGSTRLTRIAETAQATSPFIVVRADRRVIADHNDIWTQPFTEFMASLITRTDALLAR